MTDEELKERAEIYVGVVAGTYDDMTRFIPWLTWAAIITAAIVWETMRQ